MLRMFKASNEAHIKYFIRPEGGLVDAEGRGDKNIFLYNKMNTDIKQGS